MDQKKLLLIVAIAILGMIFVYAAYGPSLMQDVKVLAIDPEDAPDLSNWPFHAQMVSEDMCLRCHATGRDLPEFDLKSPIIPHEPRKLCTNCHQLPQG